MDRWVRRRLAVALLCAAIVLSSCPTGVAEASLGAYRIERLPGGETRYAFDEVSVTTPASWMGRVLVLEYGDRAIFCHEPSNRMWRQENGDETGGTLFTLGVSDSTGFRSDPDYRELGRTDRGYYYLSFPTDLQAYTADEDLYREYMDMWAAVEAVGRSATIEVFHAGPEVPSGTVEAAEAVSFDPSDAPYAGEWVTFEDGFQLYVPGDWRATEISHAEANAGIFYRAGDGTMGVAVSYLRAGDLHTREQLAGDLERVGYEEVRPVDMNGMEVVAFRRSADDYRGVAFFHPGYPGYVLLVYVSPIGDSLSDVEAIGKALLDSVSPYSTD